MKNNDTCFFFLFHNYIAHTCLGVLLTREFLYSHRIDMNHGCIINEPVMYL